MAMAAVRHCAVAGVVLVATSAANWINPPPIGRHADEPLPSPIAGLAASAPVTVIGWGFGENGPTGGSPLSKARFRPGQPLYLWLKIDGGQAAVDWMRSRGPLAIEAHWSRSGAAANPGAPDLVTDLTVGRPDLAARLAAEVGRQGYFEWHSWTRKDTLSPGSWTVSLTYSDGRPVLCREATPEPCRFALNIG